MLRREESRHDFAFMAGVVVGAVAGAAAALALTPMSGADAREKVLAKTGDMNAMKDRAVGMASSAKQRVDPVREKAAGVATTALGKVEPMREKAMELAAKSPLPVGRTPVADGEVSMEVPMPPDVAADVTATET